MRENYAARIYDFGKLDQRLEDVWADKPGSSGRDEVGG